MILYKYLSSENAVRFLDNGKVVFSRVYNFNDPFESLSYYSYQSSNDPLISMSQYFSIILYNHYSVILCLTRQALNPLMWSHYADLHRGIVVGIDVSKTNLISLKENILPAQVGNIIYTKTRPTFSLIKKEMAIDREYPPFGFKPNRIEILQRRYLYKPAYWAYEEEVRVVKNINSADLTPLEGRDGLLTMTLPKCSVKEIYFGLRFNMENLNRNPFNLISTNFPEAILKKCELNEDDWDISAVILKDNL